MSKEMTIYEAILEGYKIYCATRGSGNWYWGKFNRGISIWVSKGFVTELEAFADLRRHLDEEAQK